MPNFITIFSVLREYNRFLKSVAQNNNNLKQTTKKCIENERQNQNTYTIINNHR